MKKIKIIMDVEPNAIQDMLDRNKDYADSLSYLDTMVFEWDQVGLMFKSYAPKGKEIAFVKKLAKKIDKKYVKKNGVMGRGLTLMRELV